MNKAQALNQFWNSFGWPAYDDASVPEGVADKHISYSVAYGEFEAPVALTANLWDRSYSWEAVSLLADTIFATIGYGGVIVPFDGGKIWIKRGAPFAQRVTDEVDTIRRIYINIEAEFMEV